jgi:hypothetical protein
VFVIFSNVIFRTLSNTKGRSTHIKFVKLYYVVYYMGHVCVSILLSFTELTSKTYKECVFILVLNNNNNNNNNNNSCHDSIIKWTQVLASEIHISYL